MKWELFLLFGTKRFYSKFKVFESNRIRSDSIRLVFERYAGHYVTVEMTKLQLRVAATCADYDVDTHLLLASSGHLKAR